MGIVPSLPGAHTQAATLGELGDNLKEVLELCLEEYDSAPHASRDLARPLPREIELTPEAFIRALEEA
jgi:predicted RNase H-like HicB family nuclease